MLAGSQFISSNRLNCFQKSPFTLSGAPSQRPSPSSSLRIGTTIWEIHAEMADRFFPNQMPRFPAEAPPDELASSHSYSATLIPTELLSLPDAALSDRLRQAALNLKETVTSHTCFVLRNFRWFYAFLGFSFWPEICSFRSWERRGRWVEGIRRIILCILEHWGRLSWLWNPSLFLKMRMISNCALRLSLPVSLYLKHRGNLSIHFFVYQILFCSLHFSLILWIVPVFSEWSSFRLCILWVYVTMKNG